MTTTSRPSDDLLHALAARARTTSDGRLVLAVVGGLAGTLGIAIWRPFGWIVIGAVGLCAAAFGAWGIADRELAERSEMHRSATVTLRLVRGCSVVIGTCAAVLALLVLLGSALGTWIS